METVEQPAVDIEDDDDNDHDDDVEPTCGEQPVLRGSILLTSILLLGLGGLVFVTAIAGLLNLLNLEFRRTADLLMVPIDVTEGNLNWAFRVLGAAGYVAANIGALAVCAASGRRRAHTATAASAAGAAAVACLVMLLGAVKPRIGRIIQAMNMEQKRYFRAYVVTGDERYISQIQLHSGCCGLTKGAADFEAWGRRALPSSCCGHVSGNCTTAGARTLTCAQAVKDLVGSDGLMDLGFVVWILGGISAALSIFLFLLLFSAGQDTVELFIALRHRAEDKLRQLREGDDQQQNWQLQFNAKKLKSRDQEMHRLLAKAAVNRRFNASTGWKQLRTEGNAQGAKSQARKHAGESPEALLIRKANLEAQVDQARSQEQQQQQQQQREQRSPPIAASVLRTAPLQQDFGVSGYGAKNLIQLLEEKMKREAEIESRRLDDVKK